MRLKSLSMEKLLLDSYFKPLLDDICLWLEELVGADINADNFPEPLESGIVLCQLADVIIYHAKVLHRKCPTLHYKGGSEKGSFQARCNIDAFLKWAKALGLKDTCLFETDNVTEHTFPKNILICLLELARISEIYSVKLPRLIQLEKETEMLWKDLIKISIQRTSSKHILSVEEISYAVDDLKITNRNNDFVATANVANSILRWKRKAEKSLEERLNAIEAIEITAFGTLRHENVALQERCYDASHDDPLKFKGDSHQQSTKKVVQIPIDKVEIPVTDLEAIDVTKDQPKEESMIKEFEIEINENDPETCEGQIVNVDTVQHDDETPGITVYEETICIMKSDTESEEDDNDVIPVCVDQDMQDNEKELPYKISEQDFPNANAMGNRPMSSQSPVTELSDNPYAMLSLELQLETEDLSDNEFVSTAVLEKEELVLVHNEPNCQLQDGIGIEVDFEHVIEVHEIPYLVPRDNFSPEVQVEDLSDESDFEQVNVKSDKFITVFAVPHYSDQFEISDFDVTVEAKEELLIRYDSDNKMLEQRNAESALSNSSSTKILDYEHNEHAPHSEENNEQLSAVKSQINNKSDKEPKQQASLGDNKINFRNNCSDYIAPKTDDPLNESTRLPLNTGHENTQQLTDKKGKRKIIRNEKMIGKEDYTALKKDLLSQDHTRRNCNSRFASIHDRLGRNPSVDMKVDRDMFLKSLTFNWKGCPLLKDCREMTMMQALIADIKPRTIIELGSFTGGSAIWMADLLVMHNIPGHIYSVDINTLTVNDIAKDYVNITMIKGDCEKIQDIFSYNMLETLPHPWIIIDDCHVNTRGIMKYFGSQMKNGDYFVIEKTSKRSVKDSPPQLAIDFCASKKLKTIHKFLKKNDEIFRVDSYYSDMFEFNGSPTWDGYIRKCDFSK